MSDELNARLEVLENVIFGDPKNLKANPGVVAELSRTSFEQARTNEILTEVRGDLKKIYWTVGGLIIAALINVILRG